MCSVCLSTPCHPRCPNAPEPIPVYTCGWCKEPIFENDEYMETPEGPVCRDCIVEMGVLEFMEMIGEKFSTAEKEE